MKLFKPNEKYKNSYYELVNDKKKLYLMKKVKKIYVDIGLIL